MSNERRRIRNHEKPSEPDVPDLCPPTIGRLVLNSEALTPALTHLRTQAITFYKETPFVQMITRGHYNAVGRSDGQNILATLPDHPGYQPDNFNSNLDCRVVRMRNRIRTYDMVQCSYFLLQIEEIGGQNLLREQRSTILNHMSDLPVSTEEYAVGFRIPLASVSGYRGSVVALRNGLTPLLPDVVTLGPVQLEPTPTPMESAQQRM